MARYALGTMVHKGHVVEIIKVKDIPASYWGEFPSAWEIDSSILPDVDIAYHLTNSGGNNKRSSPGATCALLRSNLDKHRTPEHPEWGEFGP